MKGEPIRARVSQSCYLTPEVYDKLEELSEQTGKFRGVLIREIVSEYFELEETNVSYYRRRITEEVNPR